MRTLGRRRHRRGGIATLVVILARLLAVIAAPPTAYAATLAGSRVSASTLAAPLRTGPPSSLTLPTWGRPTMPFPARGHRRGGDT